MRLDASQLRDASYDTVPVRDLAFTDLAQQQTGPGRALYDGEGVLHLLVPDTDATTSADRSGSGGRRGDDAARESRTIGLLLDQHRADAGTDPKSVRVHHYRIRPGAEAIELRSDKPTPLAEARSAHGYLTMRVDQAGGLSEFLKKTRHLSWLEVRGDEVWAGGWNWPGLPASALDPEDISVLQRGYLLPVGSTRPAFSLDPKPLESEADIRAVFADLSPELANRITTGNWSGSPFRSAGELAEAVKEALFTEDSRDMRPPGAGLPSDRAQLWGLLQLLSRGPAYSEARYDGGIAGTKVGMTLFYADYLAKNWVSGVGNGVPTKAVQGFEADSEAAIPWSHCSGPGDQSGESGRLWFGPNESGFVFDANRVSIGAQATRLFARSNGAGAVEVEPSFGFGRGLRWWDQHYQAIADYESQYQRLDQIMRWSGSIEWLVTKTPARLPQLSESEIRSDRRFRDWYRQTPNLREQAAISFVSPPSASQEAVLAIPSKTYHQCGLLQISGGVSLADLVQRRGTRTFRADLPEPFRRASLYDEGSRFDAGTGSGAVTEVSVDGTGAVADIRRRSVSSTGNRFTVTTTVDGRRDAPFGALRFWRAATAQRRLAVETTAVQNGWSSRVTYQDQELGRLQLRRAENVVSLQWSRGALDRVRVALTWIQDRFLSRPAETPYPGTGLLYGYRDAAGEVTYRTGGGGEPWLSINADRVPPGTGLAFRLGVPDVRTNQPTFLTALLVPPPAAPAGHRLDVTSAAADHLAMVTIARGQPGNAERVVPVTTPDGVTSRLYQYADHVSVPADDRVLGLRGPPEGAALLAYFPRVGQAMREANQAGDRQLRAVLLGEDGLALVDANGVQLFGNDESWTATVRKVIGPGGYDDARVLFQIQDGRLLYVDKSELRAVRGSKAQKMSFTDAAATKDVEIYVNESLRATLPFRDGVLNAEAVPHNLQVTVRRVRPQSSLPAPAWPPDIRVSGGTEWRRTGPGISSVPANVNAGASLWPGPGGSAGPGPGGVGPTGSTTATAQVPAGLVLLVCPATGRGAEDCD